MSHNKTILVTRPKQQAEAFRKRIEAENFECTCLVASVLEIQNHMTSINTEGYDAILLTSQNAFPTIEKQPFFDFLLPLFCVGKKTAQMARETGFEKISHIAEDADELNAAIKKSSFKNILYLRGQNIAFDFKKELSDHGINVTEEICYEAIPVKILPEAIIDSLKTSEVDIITFFSARSAACFASLLNTNNIRPQGTKALCISDSVIESLHGYFEGKVYVSRTPDEDGMIEMLASMCCKA